MVIDAKPVQPEKALYPIEVTPSGMAIEVRPVQPSKAPYTIEVILSGMLIDVKPVQPEKAYAPIEVTVYVFALYSTPAGIINSPEIASEFPYTLTVSLFSFIVYLNSCPVSQMAVKLCANTLTKEEISSAKDKNVCFIIIKILVGSF